MPLFGKKEKEESEGESEEATGMLLVAQLVQHPEKIDEISESARSYAVVERSARMLCWGE